MMDQKHKGAYAELKVCSWLLSNGYEVFRNVSMHGSIDLIVFCPISKKIIKVDVKSVKSWRNKSGEIRHHFAKQLKKQLQAQNIVVIWFNQENGECWWDNSNG